MIVECPRTLSAKLFLRTMYGGTVMVAHSSGMSTGCPAVTGPSKGISTPDSAAKSRDSGAGSKAICGSGTRDNQRTP